MLPSSQAASALAQGGATPPPSPPSPSARPPSPPRAGGFVVLDSRPGPAALPAPSPPSAPYARAAASAARKASTVSSTGRLELRSSGREVRSSGVGVSLISENSPPPPPWGRGGWAATIEEGVNSPGRLPVPPPPLPETRGTRGTRGSALHSTTPPIPQLRPRDHAGAVGAGFLSGVTASPRGELQQAPSIAASATAAAATGPGKRRAQLRLRLRRPADWWGAIDARSDDARLGGPISPHEIVEHPLMVRRA